MSFHFGVSTTSTRTFYGIPYDIATAYVSTKSNSNDSDEGGSIGVHGIINNNSNKNGEASVVVVTSLGNAAHVRIRVTNQQSTETHEITMPMIHLRGALLGLDPDTTSPLDFLKAVHDLISIKKSSTCFEIVLHGTPMAHNIHNEADQKTNDTAAKEKENEIEKEKKKKKAKHKQKLNHKLKQMKHDYNTDNRSVDGSIASHTISIRSYSSSNRSGIRKNCIVVAGKCTDPRLKCSGFCVLDESLLPEHDERLRSGNFILHRELIAYPKCYRCHRGSGWHLPADEEVQEKVKAYNARRDANANKSSRNNSSVEDGKEQKEDVIVDVVCLAGPCTTNKVDCDGFSINRNELTPEHAKLLARQKNKKSKKNDHMIKHTDLMCYPTCWQCGRGPGWHLPSKAEIQHKLQLHPTKKVIQQQQEKDRIETISHSHKRTIRISGPCSDPRVYCRGFLLYENQLYRDHLSFLTGHQQHVNGRH